jgi:hypothetical protein
MMLVSIEPARAPGASTCIRLNALSAIGSLRPLPGAVYDVAITHLAVCADYDAICNVCQKVMNEWHGTVGRAYTLKSQPAHA